MEQLIQDNSYYKYYSIHKQLDYWVVWGYPEFNVETNSRSGIGDNIELAFKDLFKNGI